MGVSAGNVADGRTARDAGLLRMLTRIYKEHLISSLMTPSVSLMRAQFEVRERSR